MTQHEKYVAYVGTYTHGTSIGIHVYDINIEGGDHDRTRSHSSQQCLSHGKILTVENTFTPSQTKDAATAIKPDGGLEPINKVGIDGMRGCYLSTDKNGKFLYVGGYHDGKVTVNIRTATDVLVLSWTVYSIRESEVWQSGKSAACQLLSRLRMTNTSAPCRQRGSIRLKSTALTKAWPSFSVRHPALQTGFRPKASCIQCRRTFRLHEL